MRLSALLVPALSLALAASQAPAKKAGAEGTHARIQTLNDGFAGDMLKADAAAVAARYSEDAQLLFFKGATFKGRPAIQGFLQDFFKGSKLKAFTVVSEETHAMGDCILDLGHYEMTAVAEGKEESSKGRYMQVFRKEKDGKWRVFRDCPLPD